MSYRAASFTPARYNSPTWSPGLDVVPNPISLAAPFVLAQGVEGDTLSSIYTAGAGSTTGNGPVTIEAVRLYIDGVLQPGTYELQEGDIPTGQADLRDADGATLTVFFSGPEVDAAPQEQITATIAPAMSPLHDGQAVQDVENFAAMIDPASYASTLPGTLTVTVLFTGDAVSADGALTEGDTAGFIVRVTNEDTGYSQDFDTADVAPNITVGYGVRVVSQSGGTLQLDVSDGWTGGNVEITIGGDSPYVGVHSVFVPAPADFAGPLLVTTAQIDGTSSPAVAGEDLDGPVALVVPTDAGGLTGRGYGWDRYADGQSIGEAVDVPSGGQNKSYRPLSNATTFNYGRGETATDANGTMPEVFGNFVEIAGTAPTALVANDSFAGADNDPITGRVAAIGGTWEFVAGGSDTAQILGNLLDFGTTASGTRFYRLNGVAETDVEVRCQILTGTDGGAAGLTVRSLADGQLFHGRFSRSASAVQWFRRAASGNFTNVQSAAVTFNPNTWYNFVLRLSGNPALLEMYWYQDGAARPGTPAFTQSGIGGPLTLAGGVGFAFNDGGDMRIRNLEAEVI